MAEDQTLPAPPAAPAVAPVSDAPADKAIVLLKDTPFEFGEQLAGKGLRLPADAADKLIASGAARLASPIDIAVAGI